jgi:hypothetical protein
MQKVACPGCGAEVAFRSAASVMAVCEYCRTAVLKEAAAVRDIGKIAPVFEDYSPLQIGVSGIWGKIGFTLVGRLQLKYGAGYWNEWRALLDDGTDAWLSDASGQYVMTSPRPAPSTMPGFADLKPGFGCTFAGNRYIAADVREARCVAGEGELPFKVGEGWVLKAADFRWRDRFLTLDYSESETPVVYAGRSVTLDELKCQLLRSPDDIKDSAGRYRGAAVPLSCPGCGSGIEYRTGLATHVVCASCHAEVDCAGEKAEVLAKHDAIEQVATTLKPGEEAKIGNTRWTIIGLACHTETDSGESSTWTEYLLFNGKQGLMWLVEAADGWKRVRVLDNWPEVSGDTMRYMGDVYKKLYDYGGEVTYAAGNFNWQVQVGDRVSITDYGHDDKRLSMEKSDTEVTWSHAQPVAASEVMKWFGHKVDDAAALDKIATSDGDFLSFATGWPMWTALILLALFNFKWMFADDDVLAMVIVGFAAWLVYLPVQIAKKFNPGGEA